MNTGPRISKLLEWAENHSPRTKELHRYITDIHTAIEHDLDNRRKLIKFTEDIQLDRDGLAKIAWKIFNFFGRPDQEKNMTEAEFRLYVAARINLSAASLIGKPLTEENTDWLKRKCEEALEEAIALGCQNEQVLSMRDAFHKSLDVRGSVQP